MPYKSKEDRDKWLAKNPDYMKNYLAVYRRNKSIEKYGLDPASVPAILVCETCSSTTRVAFDHDHATGKFRGWLCVRCNTLLGRIHDDVELLKNLALYLSK